MEQITNTVPMITYGGKTYTAIPPKVQAWHDFVAFESGVIDTPAELYLEKMAELIASVFEEEVTKDMVMDALRIDEIKPFFKKVFLWIVRLVNSRLEEVPNVETV